MSHTFKMLLVWIVIIAIVGFGVVEIMNFINEASEISSGTSN